MSPDVGEEILTALDLGGTKVCVILGVVRDGGVSAIGMGTVPSHGIQKGIVVDIDLTVEAVLNAVREAERQAGVKAGPAYATISGKHIKSVTADGSVAVHHRDHEVTEEDLRRVIEQAQGNAKLPSDHDVLHTIPEEFSVDEQEGIRNPVGMYGSKLTARVRIITGAVTCIQNVIRCIQHAEMGAGGLILHSLASERSVLTPDEREMGVVCLDIGGTTTDMALLSGKTLRHTAVLALGGNQITKDISIGLRIPFESAEAIKRQSGCALAAEVREDEIVQIPSLGGRQARTVPRRSLARIIEARVEEMLEHAKEELNVSGYTEDQLSGGLVLTGGCAQLPFIVEKAEQVFERPAARVGVPDRIGGGLEELRQPEYAAAAGLLFEAAEQRRRMPAGRRRSTFGGFARLFREWLRGA